jgi:hypothetical protein
MQHLWAVWLLLNIGAMGVLAAVSAGVSLANSCLAGSGTIVGGGCSAKPRQI